MNKRIRTVVKPGEAPQHRIFISEEEMALLRQLRESHGWKVYQDVLYASRDQVLLSLLTLEDPTKVERRIGQALGLHLSGINLDLYLAENKKDEKKEEAKNQAKGGDDIIVP